MDNRYEPVPEKSLLEKLMVGFDKPDSHFRSILASKLLDAEDTPSSDDIYAGKAGYSPRQLIDALERKTGLDLYFGDKGKDYDPSYAESIGNFVADLGAAVVTSPMTLGLGALTKGAKAALGAETALGKTAAGKGLELAAARGLGGGVVGALTADKLEDVPLNAAIGASVAGLGSPLLTSSGKAINKYMTKYVDRSMESLNPEVFANTEMKFSEAAELAGKNQLKRDAITRGIKQRDYNLGLKNLSPKESETLAKFTDDMKLRTFAERNAMEAEMLRESAGISKANASGREGLDLYQAARKEGQTFGDRFVHDKNTNKLFKQAGGKGKVTEVGVESLPKNGLKPVKDLDSLDTLHYGSRNSKGVLGGKGISKEQLGVLTTKANTKIGKEVEKRLADIGDDTLNRNVKNFVYRNREMVNDYNKVMRESAERAGKKYIDTVPIDFHTYEVIPEKLLKNKNFDSELRTGFVRRMSEEPVNTGGLTLGERLQAEAETFANHYMTKQEKEAQRILSGVVNFKSAKDGVEGTKNMLRAFDKFTNFIKQQHLTMSHSWVVNNMTDNLVKAYMSGGIGNALRTGSAQLKALFRMEGDDMIKDLLKLTDPNGGFKTVINLSDDLMGPALESGAIGESFFRESFGKGQISKAALTARVGEEEAAKIMASEAAKGTAKKAYDAYADTLAATVGRSGQLVEGAARGQLFKSTVNKIAKSDEMLRELGINMTSKEFRQLVKEVGYDGIGKVAPLTKRVFNEAARVVNDTFFDYGNISAFEQKVMKRIFPYWTFFSRNLNKWAQYLGDNPAGLSDVLKVQRSLGRDMTSDERTTMPDYLLASGARMDKNGNPIAMPNVSYMDALNMNPFNIRRSSLEKLHPLLKTIYQLVAGKDQFGGELLPSNTSAERKRAYGSATKFEGAHGIYRDAVSNKLYNDSDATAIATMLQSNLIPTPIIDTIFKSRESLNHKGATIDEVGQTLAGLKRYRIDERDKRAYKRLRLQKARKKIRNDRTAVRNRGTSR